MAKQRLPSREELTRYNELCSIAFSRMAGTKVNVVLEPFQLPAHVTKSEVFGAHTRILDSEASVPVPSKVIVKRYLTGRHGTSDTRETASQDFRREKAVLGLDIGVGNGSGQPERVYPRLYSGEAPECDEPMLIIREFIPGLTLEQLAEEQLKNGGLKWETATGPSISDPLHPIALLHVKTPEIRAALKERGVLHFGYSSDSRLSELLAEDRSQRFSRYLQVLAQGQGTEMKLEDFELARVAFYTLDHEFVSRANLISIVDGELDVFPHHAMSRRLPDAGGVEVGGFVRDLALYSAPALQSLWGSPEKMPQRVRETYLQIRKQLEERLRHEQLEIQNDTIDMGILFASFAGSFRKAAAVVFYNGRDEGYPVQQETDKYVKNSGDYLNAFNRALGRGRYHNHARMLLGVLERYNLVNGYNLASNREIRRFPRAAMPSPKKQETA